MFASLSCNQFHPVSLSGNFVTLEPLCDSYPKVFAPSDKSPGLFRRSGFEPLTFAPSAKATACAMSQYTSPVGQVDGFSLITFTPENGSLIAYCVMSVTLLGASDA